MNQNKKRRPLYVKGTALQMTDKSCLTCQLMRGKAHPLPTNLAKMIHSVVLNVCLGEPVSLPSVLICSPHLPVAPYFSSPSPLHLIVSLLPCPFLSLDLPRLALTQYESAHLTEKM